jgi:hypothetical protein
VAGRKPLFAEVPSMSVLRRDLGAAGIPYRDSEGRGADFHAFRHTLATNLSRAGVAPRVAMEIMRHSDTRLTHKVYTDAALLPLREGVAMLPRFTAPAGGQYTQIRTQVLGAEGHAVARSGAEAGTGELEKTPVNQGDCHGLARAVAEWRVKELAPEVGLASVKALFHWAFVLKIKGLLTLIKPTLPLPITTLLPLSSDSFSDSRPCASKGGLPAAGTDF